MDSPLALETGVLVFQVTMMICLPLQGTTPPKYSSRHGPQRPQHTASTAATPRHHPGRKTNPRRRVDPTQPVDAHSYTGGGSHAAVADGLAVGVRNGSSP